MNQFIDQLAKNKVIKRLAQTCRSYKSLGWKDFVKNGLCVKYEMLLVEKNLNEQSIYSSRNNLEVLAIEKEQKHKIIEFYKKTDHQVVDPAVLADRYFANGCKCLIAVKNNNIIGCFWWGDSSSEFEKTVPELSFFRGRINLEMDDAVGVDFFILPEERGGGAALEFYSKTCAVLRELGYNRLFGLVSPENRAARWTYKLLGHVELRTVVVYKVLNYAYFFK